MRSFKYLPNLILGLGIACLTISSVLALAKVARGPAQKKANNPDLPQVISKVKGIEVVNVAVERQSESDATVVVELRNNSEKPVIAIAIEAGDDKDASGVSASGFKAGDEPPAVVIKPHETYTMRMPLSYVRQGSPIKVGAVMYADGTDEGEAPALGTLRRQREHEKKPKKEGATSPL